MKNYTVIGKSEKKIDSLSLATGASKFVDDFDLTDPLYLIWPFCIHRMPMQRL